MLLRLTQLVKRFPAPRGTVTAVDGISLELDAGEFVALHGPSGGGKTTLLLMAGGLLSPDAGTVELRGVNPYTLPADDRAAFRADQVGFVFQQFHLIPYLDVLDNVLVGELAGPAPATDLRERARRLLDQFHLSPRRHHVPAALSVGEQQRVALARALLRSPSLLLADEPTGNLDAENARIIWRNLAAFARQGGAVLMVTHDPQARAAADRALHLTAGRLDEAPPPRSPR